MAAQDLTIADVLAHYGGSVNVPESGWRSIRCPWHDDTCASASVDLSRNAFVCHTCPIKGDPIGVIMMVEKIGYREACEFCTEILGKSSPSISQPVSKSGKPRKTRSRKWREILE